MLTSRQISILKVIIDDFIYSATPIGSNTLKNVHKLPYSSATIRNEMATLEDLGLLEKTHTSSGRIPSEEGYRYYVDYLLEKDEIDEILKERIEEVFNNRKLEIHEVIKETCNIIASMTNYTSIALGSDSKNETLASIRLVPISEKSAVFLLITSSGKVESKIFNLRDSIKIDDMNKFLNLLNEMLIGVSLSDVVEKLNSDIKSELVKYVSDYEELLDAFTNAFVKFASDYVYISGKNNIINQPDFNDVEKIKSLINIIESNDFFDILSDNIEGIKVSIGTESKILETDGVSIISSSFKASEIENGVLAIIGPTRMNYDKVIKIMEYTIKRIEDLTKEKRGEYSE